MMRGTFRSTSILCLCIFGLGMTSAAQVILPTGDITENVSGAWNTTPQNDTGSSSDPLANVFDATVNRNVLELKYDLGTGNFVNIESGSFLSTINLLSLGNALRFSMRGSGLVNEMKVELKDTAGAVFQSVTLTTRVNDYATVTLPFSGFNYAFGGGNTTASVGDLPTQELGFTLQPVTGGSGRVDVDQVVVTSIGNTYSAEFIIDNCENRSVNTIGANVIHLGSTLANTLNAFAPPEGATYLELRNVSPTAEGGLIEPLTSTPGFINARVYTHLSFYIRTLVADPGSVGVALVDSLNEEERLTVQDPDYLEGGTFANDRFKQVLIPLVDFKGGQPAVDLKQLSKVVFFVPASSTILLDKVSFLSLTYTTKPDVVLDSMDTFHSQSSWSTLVSDGATLQLSTETGQQGNALGLTYTFGGGAGSGQFAKASRGFALNVLQDNANAFAFDYLGTGERNNLEFKVVDNNDTTFFFKALNVSSTNAAWKTMTIDYNKLSYFGGSDHEFSFRNISRIAFAVSKGNGGVGTLRLHNIRFLKKDDLTTALPADRLITSLSIDNNPFAPQSNRGISTATFTFTLSQNAKVTLKIFDLSGSTARVFEAGELSAGTHALTWDGLISGRLARNGLYLFQLTAEGAGTTQRIKNVIGVVR